MGKEESGLRKILIVEDDKVLNKTLAYNLTADGYEVTSVYSFQDAVERLKKSEFDIALLDINLPDGNGLHLCNRSEEEGSIFRLFIPLAGYLAIFGNPVDCAVYLDFLYNGESEKTISCRADQSDGIIIT